MSPNPNETAAMRLSEIVARINRAASRIEGTTPPELVAVSKTFGADAILPLIAAGQRRFGENRVQEAQAKWPELKAQYPDLILHLIGPLQTNKAKDAVALFDFIESVDREKLARVLAEEMARQDKQLPCFVQVNIGNEPQKAGIAVSDTIDFVAYCQNDLGLQVVGLMCIPPVDVPPGPFFGQLKTLAEQAGLEKLSMGMSADFETAVLMGASQVRVGSALFGTR